MIRLLSDDTIRALLYNAVDGPKTVADLAKELGIPLSTAYRYVDELCKAGLMAPAKIAIRDEGSKVIFYRSTIRRLTIRYEGTSIMVEAQPNEDMAEKAVRLWYLVGGRKYGD